LSRVKRCIVSAIAIPKLDLERAGKADVVQVRIGKLAQHLVDTEIEFVFYAPVSSQVVAKLLEEPERVDLAVLLRLAVHENEMRTLELRVYPKIHGAEPELSVVAIRWFSGMSVVVPAGIASGPGHPISQRAGATLIG
jgi:hypothetical protein